MYSDLQGTHDWETALARHVHTIPIVPGECDEWEGGGVIGALPWVRWSMPQLTGDRPPSGCEMLVLGHAPGKMHWGGPGNLTCLRHKCERVDEKHPTAKPLDQMLDLVAWFSDPGELVYDPCAGRGTTGVACALLGRRFLGCEMQEDEAAKGQERITKAQRGELSERDTERWRRWLESLGAPVTEGSLRNPFRKGLPIDVAKTA